MEKYLIDPNFHQDFEKKVEKYFLYEQIYYLCEKAGILIPDEVRKFFNFKPPPQHNTGVIFPQDEFADHKSVDYEEEEWINERDRIERGIQGNAV
ncbi:MAG: hypothetical protein SV062_08135 [Thermodesulfobacteriota bacterium]|nr:hypothetical protein [Thermodesulfobacteriota bacterium]